MSKTYAQILDDVEAWAQDGGIDPGGSANTVFATAEIDAIMPSGLVAISRHRPWEYKLTKTTTADSYDLTLTTGDKWRLMTGTSYKGTGIVKAEYKVDLNPREFRGVNRLADILSLELDSRPSSAVSVYLFMNKVHILQSALGTTDTAGAIKTLAAAGAVSLALKSLGTGTINDMSTLTIAGDTTTYYVISQATIAANEATVSIWPPLVAAAAVDAVVTLAVTSSTMDMPTEELLSRWLAAKACIYKSTKYYSQVQAAITTLSNAATAVAAIAARITQAVADVASARTALALGVTAITEADTEFDLINPEVDSAKTEVALVNPEVDDAKTKIASALTELNLVNTEIDLAKTALSSGNSLINTIPVGGGAGEYMGQASADVGVGQGYLISGQGILQSAQAALNLARGYLESAGGYQGTGRGYHESGRAYLEKATADNANASGYLSAGLDEARAAAEKNNEAISNLRLVASRMQVSQGGVRYEEWGRRELQKVETELLALGGLTTSVRYNRD